MSWTTLQDGAAISASGNDEFSLPSSVTDGTTVSFQYRYDTSNPSSGSYTGADSVTIDCPYINPAATQSFTTTCSAGARTNSLVLTNASPANTTAYFLVEYSLDDEATWNVKESNQSVAVGGSETLTQSVADTKFIVWRYKTSLTSGSFTGDYTTMSDSCLLYTSPSPRDQEASRMPSSA